MMTPQEILSAVVKPFFKEGVAKVHVSTCCKRVFVGIVAPTKCSTCSGTFLVGEVSDLTQINYSTEAIAAVLSAIKESDATKP